jgi:hypothetical protein
MYLNNFRISDLQSSGLDRFIVDPDGYVQYAIIEEHVREKLLNIAPPLLKNWTDDMSVIPENFCYTHIYEYLVKRTITILSKSKESDSEEDDLADLEFDLPIAEKPLRKGYNFYGSGHVKEIKLCPVTGIIHVKASVMASMRDKIYMVSVTVEKNSSLILNAKCQCVAGAGGKCNHVAGVLFALLEYRESMRNRSCTDKPQEWHLPSRKSKQHSKPVKTGIKHD